MQDASTAPRRRFTLFWGAAAALLVLAGVGITSPAALLAVVVHGLSALLVLVPPVLLGLAIVRRLPFGAMPRRWHLLLGATLGLGLTSLLVLGLGLAGLLHRGLWVILMVAFSAAGLVSLRSGPVRPSHGDHGREGKDEAGGSAWAPLWLLGVPFLCLALLAAANPPGLVWSEEGYGYDVLEYHLEMPKEYRQAGRIFYAPHNVYANFPANVEMLYLLAMIVHDEDVDAGVTANLIHLAFAGLFVFAAWAAGREWSPRCGIVCGVAAATCGWLAYLSGLAYVENGMLFFGMVSLAMLLRLMNPAGSQGDARRRSRLWIAAAGLAAGWACGCKYTALPMLGLPLIAAAAWLPAPSWPRRAARAALFCMAMLMTLAPWLVKNQIATGNPVFPLANGVFEASPPGWGPEQTARWNAGHSPSLDELSIGSRLADLCRHVPGDHDQRFGPALLLVAIGGLWRRRLDRTDGALLLVLLAQIGVWLMATHLYARFAVILLIPLSLLAGRALPDDANRVREWIIAGLLICGATWNFVFAARLHAEESAAGVPASALYEGLVPGYEFLQAVNLALPSDAKILLVGEARAFYFVRNVDYTVAFNRSPFVEAVRESDSDERIVAWLRQRGYTHVLVNWAEVSRLSRTYGFAPEVNLSLFERLCREGGSLRAAHGYEFEGKPYVTIYELRRR